MKIKVFLRIILFFIFCISTAHIFAQQRFTYDYHVVELDSTYAQHPDSVMQQYLTTYKQKMDIQMNVIIGQCEQTMSSFAPQSELSNFLTDMLYEIGDHYCQEYTGRSADLSLLNFGGIRNDIPAGEITVGTIYKLSPFDNTIVIIQLKGNELQKVFERFTDTHNQPYSHAQIIYENHKPTSIRINGKKIRPNKTYHLITIDFVQTGGDKILSDIHFENVFSTSFIMREAFIEYLKNTQNYRFNGKKIKGQIDDRVIIK